MRRNLSNIGQVDFSNTIMEDVSRMTVSRAECKAGAALLMSTRLFFAGMRYEFEENCQNDSAKIAFYSYRQDATNHRNKKCTMELDSAYGIVPAELLQLKDGSNNNVPWDTFFSKIRRISDVLPVEDESGAGCLGFTLKAFQSLGCPDWLDASQSNWSLCGAI